MSLWDRVNNPSYKSKPKPKAEVFHLDEFREEIAKKKTPPKPEAWDNRIKCIQCIHLATNGQCLNARAAGAPGRYHPVVDIPRRCGGYDEGKL